MQQVKGNFKNKKGSVKIEMPIFSFKEDDVTIIYAPALDLCGYGYSEEDAQESFKITLREFLDYTTNKGTFEKELKRLGWKVKKNKPMTLPDLSKLLVDREYLTEIFNEKDFRKYNAPIALPVNV